MVNRKIDLLTIRIDLLVSTKRCKVIFLQNRRQPNRPAKKEMDYTVCSEKVKIFVNSIKKNQNFFCDFLN